MIQSGVNGAEKNYNYLNGSLVARFHPREQINTNIMEIGYVIKKLRISKGYKQCEFSNKCCINQSYLSCIESNKKIPSIKTLELISNALNIPLPFLIFYSIREIDVPEGKKAMYRILQPHIKQMINDIVFGNIPR